MDRRWKAVGVAAGIAAGVVLIRGLGARSIALAALIGLAGGVAAGGPLRINDDFSGGA